MLHEERNNIADQEIDKLLKRISIIVGEPIPLGIAKSKEEDQWQDMDIHWSFPLPKEDSSVKFSGIVKDPTFKNKIPNLFSDSLPLWEEILTVFS